VRYRRHDTQICVADPDHSVFFDYYLTGDKSLTAESGSRVEGIGRPRVEPSFVRGVIDAMVKVPDAYSLAALRYLEGKLGRKCGGSTGTIFSAALSLAGEMRAKGEQGSIVAILCDGGERYLHSYYNDEWIKANGFDIAAPAAEIARFSEDASAPAWPLPIHRQS
jgi:cysteine synthase A